MAENERKRWVEVYVGVGDSQGGEWYVIDIDVDASLTEEEAGKAALAIAQEKWQDEIAFMGVYSVWSDDSMEESWSELDEED